MSEVRGSSREYQTVMAQKWPRGATLHPRSGGAAKRSYPASKARGGSREELPHAPKPEARGGSWEKQPMPEAWGCDERSYPTSEVRGSGREELPHAPKPEIKGGGGEEQLHD